MTIITKLQNRVYIPCTIIYLFFKILYIYKCISLFKWDLLNCYINNIQ